MAENKLSERISLESNSADATEQQARRGGVKLNRDKSKFSKQESPETFENLADATHDHLMDRKDRAVKLVKQFWDAVQDTTLADAKGPLAKKVEAELITNLLSLGRELNTDENEPEGSGSIALITLLLKTIMRQRDVRNDLAFKLDSLEKKLDKLSRAHGTGPSK